MMTAKKKQSSGFEIKERSPLEECVIGLLWIDHPNDTALATIQEDWFSDPINRSLFEHLKTMRNEGRPADLVLEWDKLTSFQVKRLTDGMQAATSSALMTNYMRMLRARYCERIALDIVGSSGGRLADEEKEKIKILMDDIESSEGSTFSSPRDILPKVMETIERRMKYGREMPTGFDKLDDITDGLRRGELWIVGAYTSVGKTIFLTSLAHLLARKEKRVLYFTTEMAKDEYIRTRILPAFAQVHPLKIKAGNLSEEDLKKIQSGISSMQSFPLWVADESFPSLENIRGIVRIVKPDVLFLDHIHRCNMPKAENRNLALTMFVSALKTVAREQNIPIVAAAQLNRTSQVDDAAPSLMHLRDSGSLEMESDVVILLNRRLEKRGTEMVPGKEIRVNIAKNRHGDLATFEMEIDSSVLLMTEKTEDVLPPLTEPRGMEWVND